ncbi:MAG: insulinase family protein, partial [Muribaculaceae bacterium]|nr:insulinase family protein [Muribaculaceae bacterium]
VDSLMQLYRQRVARPDQFTYIFAGDLDVDTVAALAQRYIGSLHAIDNQPALEPAHPILLVPGERTVTVQAPPATERAMIQITQSGPMEWSLEHELLTLFYGHVVEAVVNAVLREEHQLTYGVQATTQLLRTQPRWSLQLQYACKPHAVDSSLLMLNQAIELIASRGVSDQLFGKVKQMMLRQHADDVATNAYWVNVLRNRALERDIHTDLTRLLEELTSDQFDTFVNHLTRDTHITVLYTP